MYVRASAHSEQTIKQLFIEYGWDRVDFLSSLRQFNYVQFCISLLCVRSPTFPIHIHLFCTLLPSVESNRIESSWIGSDGIMDLCYSIIIPDYPENKSENNKCKCDRRRKNKKIRKSRIEIRLKPQHVRFSHFVVVGLLCVASEFFYHTWKKKHKQSLGTSWKCLIFSLVLHQSAASSTSAGTTGVLSPLRRFRCSYTFLHNYNLEKVEKNHNNWKQSR